MKKMAVYQVRVAADVFWVCLNHALSTEKEEVMGLLIGEIDENKVSHVSAVIVLKRRDKRPNRVEISPEQLSDAAVRAEDLAHRLKKPMRVLGWYHSHPKITVNPSHIDVRTQATYQLMDEGFIGLIFSVFNEDRASKVGKVQITCFQSLTVDTRCEEKQVPFHIVPVSQISQTCLDSIIDLPSVLYFEEMDAYNSVVQNPIMDVLGRLHNSAVCTRALCHITEIVSIPLLQTLENKIQNNLDEIEKLKKEKEALGLN